MLWTSKEKLCQMVKQGRETIAVEARTTAPGERLSATPQTWGSEGFWRAGRGKLGESSPVDVRGGGRSPRAGHLCLLLGLSKGGPCPRTETGRGGPSSQVTTFLSGELQGLQKDVLDLWKVHTFSGRRRTFSGMFFKVKALRKGKPGD